MAVADDRRRKMPRAEDRQFPRAVTLAYKEAVRIVNPLEPEFKGEVKSNSMISKIKTLILRK